jgi:hypothetical protein
LLRRLGVWLLRKPLLREAVAEETFSREREVPSDNVPQAQLRTKREGLSSRSRTTTGSRSDHNSCIAHNMKIPREKERERKSLGRISRAHNQDVSTTAVPPTT